MLAFLNVSSNVKLHTVKVGKCTYSSYMLCPLVMD